MPIGPYSDFAACVADQKSKGHSDESAHKICGAIERKVGSNVFTLFGLRRDTLSTDGVERAEPNGPPTAFRIWAPGDNVTDHGPTRFTDNSARLLLEEQAKRGNLYSIDVDHMSLDKSAPIENHQAVGWFSLDVRNGELWATNIEWVNDTIKAGLTKGAWKYMSPAYEVNEADEVVSFLNLSLTGTPATHSTTALASRGRSPAMATEETKKMTWAALKSAIDGDDEDAKAKAYATIAAAFPGEEPDGDEPKKDDAADGDEPKKDAADEPEKKDSADDDEAKKASTSLAATVQAMAAELAAMKASKVADERKSLLASRADLAPELRKILETAPIAMVRDVCAKVPKAAASVSKSTETIQATRGARPGVPGAGQNERPTQLAPTQRAFLDAKMGLATVTDGIKWQGGSRVFPVQASLTPSKVAEPKSITAEEYERLVQLSRVGGEV